MLELITFVLIMYFGYLFVNLVIKDLQFLERLALAYLLGIGLTTIFIFIYSWAGIKITIVSLISLLIILIACLSLVSKFLKRKPNLNHLNILKQFIEFKWYEKILCFIICLLFLSTIVVSVYYPVTAWDALALYDFRAKVIVETGYFVQIAKPFESFFSYPLLTSLTHVIVYLAGGSNPQFTYSLYYIAFTILCFRFIRRYSNRYIALFFTLIIITDPTLYEHSTIAYTNLPYTVFYVAGIFYLINALIKDRYDYLFISSLLIGLSTWTRSGEPFWFTGILLVLAYSFYKKKIYPLIVYLPTFLIIQQPWKICQTILFSSGYSTSNQFVIVGKTLLLQNINMTQVVEVFNYVYQNVVLPWIFIFSIFIIAVTLNIRVKMTKAGFLLLTIIILDFAALLIGTYHFSLSYPYWKDIPGSAARMSMFFPPLIICYCAIVIANKFKVSKRL